MLIVMCLIGMVASVAWAYPGPDSFGVYLETESVDPLEVCTTVGFLETQRFWLVVSDLSESQVAAWEARLEISAAGEGVWSGFWVLTSGTDYAPDPNDFQVGNGAAPLQPNTVNSVALAYIDLLIINVDVPIEFYILPVPDSLSFPGAIGYAWDAGFPITCVSSTGGPTYPVFIANPTGGICTVVGNEVATWGAVKTLYK